MECSSERGGLSLKYINERQKFQISLKIRSKKFPNFMVEQSFTKKSQVQLLKILQHARKNLIFNISIGVR